MKQDQVQLKRQRFKVWSKRIVISLIVLLIYIWAFGGISFSGIKESAMIVTASIFDGLINPDWGYVYDPAGEDLLRGLLETVGIAFLGIFISTIIAFPISFWAASNLSKYRIISGSGKGVLSFIRTFPDIVMALLFIKAVGPGPFAGVLALGVGAVGMLGKLYAEDIENLDHGPSEALLATGANKAQIFLFAILPQVLPSLVSSTLYRLEINVRSASILGIIGAGGIGTALIFALQVRDWSRVGIILFGIIFMVLIIDLISSSIRKRLV
ncbi:phosphonate ABC transporter, permease protein PhnE [Aureibacillus halotolerans]|uniref:Phosphonate transport system permease protein n=1 Tax=Aureibacillus halotolerans TaxID=1508390 RepID=A0A4R6UDA5_9BACI|nr:phosphonate ABC transporter, permease protein PhnE [Aureibacillus halotolerans]TDQ42765.1 phosphonate transport system permease protein [Aureibacillus halotolerans]